MQPPSPWSASEETTLLVLCLLAGFTLPLACPSLVACHWLHSATCLPQSCGLSLASLCHLLAPVLWPVTGFTLPLACPSLVACHWLHSATCLPQSCGLSLASLCHLLPQSCGLSLASLCHLLAPVLWLVAGFTLPLAVSDIACVLFLFILPYLHRCKDFFSFYFSK